MKSITNNLDRTQYVELLFNHVRDHLTLEETTELIAGSSVLTSCTGVEALERWVTEGISESMQSARPPNMSSNYGDTFIRMVEDLPPSLAEQEFWAEIEHNQRQRQYGNEYIFAEINLFEAAEDFFDVDFSDEILKAIYALDECESKVDMLEARGEISGDEWYERTIELANA